MISFDKIVDSIKSSKGNNHIDLKFLIDKLSTINKLSKVDKESFF